VVPSAAYRVIELRGLGGGSVEALALNNQGNVVGFSQTRRGLDRAFLYSHGRMKTLCSLLNGGAYATGINDKGQIVGWSTNKKGTVSLAFLYNNGRVKAIGKLPPERVTHAAPSFSINDRVQVIGFSSQARNAQVLAAGRLKDLGSLKGFGSVALGINDPGAIVGYSYITPYRDFLHPGTVHPFLYQHGHMTDLGTLGGTSAAATAVDNAGDVVGWSGVSGDGAVDAFLDRNGTMIDLGNLGGPSASATAVNDRGQVVGWSYTNGGTRVDQFLYSNGRMIDLTSLVVARTGITLYSVAGINNRGQIAASGTNRFGQNVALLLTPV
jgi:probable HAF family extracellular repeat protein